MMECEGFVLTIADDNMNIKYYLSSLVGLTYCYCPKVDGMDFFSIELPDKNDEKNYKSLLLKRYPDMKKQIKDWYSTGFNRISAQLFLRSLIEDSDIYPYMNINIPIDKLE